MATQKELDEFDKLFAEDIDAIKNSTNGPYRKEIEELLHLSGQASVNGTIAIVPTETYSMLITLVERASQKNLSQAELATRIRTLGDIAISIAKKVEGLAKVLI